MQFVPFEPDIEILGHGVSFVTAGFRIAPSIGERFLVKHGVVPVGPDGKMKLDPDAWYSQARWLRAFEEIAREVGPNVLFEIGNMLGQQARTADGIKDVPGSLQYLDAGYHAYHRKQGKLMFDEATGRMLEGIGHYGCRLVQGQKRIVSVCENPYPCRFDHGLLTGLTARYGGGRVEHDDKAPCRLEGARSCTYLISW
jgi:hypothetical protein